MILDKIVFYALLLIEQIIVIFPVADPDILTNISNFSTQFREYLLGASYFFPVNTLMQLMSIIIAMELAYALFKIIKWIASIITLGIIK